MQRMTRPRGFAAGTVDTAEVILKDMPNGQSFAELRILMEPRQRTSGKPYQQEVIVRLFGDGMDKAKTLCLGQRIGVYGDFDTEQTHAVSGRVFSNLVILARDFEELEVE